jgi:hypothetical protein
VVSPNDGLILVDSGAPFTAALMKILRPAPDGLQHALPSENTGGNEALAQAGAKIIARKYAKWMATPYWIPAEDRHEKPRPKAAQLLKRSYERLPESRLEQIDYGYLIEAHRW